MEVFVTSYMKVPLLVKFELNNSSYVPRLLRLSVPYLSNSSSIPFYNPSPQFQSHRRLSIDYPLVSYFDGAIIYVSTSERI
jgi:hypothetical protein